MSEDEPDYLSDDFLAQCVQQDVRPGLHFRHAEKRKHELLKQMDKDREDHKKKAKSIKVIEAEQREKGMNTAISSENKGFKMLEKMGFKPGMTLGATKREETDASSSSSRGLVEPLKVEVKTNRVGFGEKTRMEEKRAKLNEWKETRNKLSDPNNFRNRMSEESQQKEIAHDLRKSQLVCRNLDLQKDKTEPDIEWYWPLVVKEDNSEENEDKEETTEVEQPAEIPPEPAEQLARLTSYLRDKYYYCVWCGANYDDDDDLRISCPGTSRQDH